MRGKSRLSLLSIAIIIIAIILLIMLIMWIVSPKAKVTTDADGNKTIETPQEQSKTDLKEATPEVQEKFTISDVKVANQNGFTVTTGKIKNNDTKLHKVSVQVVFYNEKNRIAGSADSLLEGLASGETRDFTLTTMGDLTANRNEVKVEFLN